MNKMRGFTLIEMMISLLIVGLLVSIATSSYQSHVLRVRRSEAETLILQMAQEQERLFTTTNQYDFTVTRVSPTGATAGDVRYQLSVLAGQDAAGFQVQAVPVNQQLADSNCGTVSLDALGRKYSSGGGAETDCWK